MNETGAAEKNAAEMSAADRQRALEAMEEQLDKASKGTMRLKTPIRAGGKDVNEISYDFNALTGRDYANAMDRETGSAASAFRMSTKQALWLFAEAAAKATAGVDATDIVERMGIQDAMKAAQIATVFFAASIRAAGSRITNG